RDTGPHSLMLRGNNLTRAETSSGGSVPRRARAAMLVGLATHDFDAATKNGGEHEESSRDACDCRDSSEGGREETLCVSLQPDSAESWLDDSGIGSKNDEHNARGDDRPETIGNRQRDGARQTKDDAHDDAGNRESLRRGMPNGVEHRLG